MSTNVSLVNNGTSINFDGQVLQNQQEAEIEREEQMQQNELRQLLSNAFDDLDDDLSIASSEDDSVNNSHISSHHDSFSALPDRPAHSVDSSGRRATSLAATAVLASQHAASPSGSHSGQHAHHWPPHRGHSNDHNHNTTQSSERSSWNDAIAGGKSQASITQETVRALCTETFRNDLSTMGSARTGAPFSVGSSFPFSIPSSSQQSTLPAYSQPQPSFLPPTSSEQYWATHTHNPALTHNPAHYHHDSQPSDSKHHPHPYPSYMYTAADNFTSQHEETPAPDQYRFQGYSGEIAPTSHGDAANFGHAWTSEGSGAPTQQGFAAPHQGIPSQRRSA